MGECKTNESELVAAEQIWPKLRECAYGCGGVGEKFQQSKSSENKFSFGLFWLLLIKQQHESPKKRKSVRSAWWFSWKRQRNDKLLGLGHWLWPKVYTIVIYRYRAFIFGIPNGNLWLLARCEFCLVKHRKHRHKYFAINLCGTGQAMPAIWQTR